MKFTVQSEHYAVVKVDGGNEGKNNWDAAMQSVLKSMEDLLEAGYRPLHYLPRINSWVCEKLTNESKKAA